MALQHPHLKHFVKYQTSFLERCKANIATVFIAALIIMKDGAHFLLRLYNGDDTNMCSRKCSNYARYIM